MTGQNGGPSRDSPRAMAALTETNGHSALLDPRSLVFAEQKLVQGMAVGYRPQLPIYGIRGAEILGWYFFTDVEVMRLHDAVRLPLTYVLGPQQYAEWNIEGSSPAVVRFAAEQLQWFWLNAMPDILMEGYTYGWSAAELEYIERDGLLVFHRATTFSPRDVMPLVIPDGKRRGTPVGVRVTNLMGGVCNLWGWREDVPNKAFWYAHRPRGGLRFGESQIRPAWRYWRQLAGVDGVEEIEQIAAHRLGTGVVKVLHPNDTVTAQNSGLPQYAVDGMVHTRDIARFMAANLKAGAGVVLSSENWPSESGGGPKWDIKAESFNTNLGDLGAYDDRLGRKCSKSIEVPPELFEAAQTGSGYSGRAIPLQGFLVGQQTNLQRSTVQAHQQAIEPLVKWNYGPKSWCRITPKPLTESVRKSSWETPGAGGSQSQGVALPPEPGGGGGGAAPPSGPSGMMGGITHATNGGVIGAIGAGPLLDAMDLPELLALREQTAVQVENARFMAKRPRSDSGPGLFDEPSAESGVRHAPVGGTDAAGKHYTGGEFIPAEATAPEPSTVEPEKKGWQAPEATEEARAATIGQTVEEYQKDTERMKNYKPPEVADDDEYDHTPLQNTYSKHILLADRLEKILNENEPVDAKTLFEQADLTHGGSRAENKYQQSEAYDSLEAGFNQHLYRRTDPTQDLAGAQRTSDWIEGKLNSLPTQTNRTGNKVSMQQFSTPPHYSYAVTWLANIQPDDTVVEPSAGTGSMTVHAQNAGVPVVANELDKRRAAFLAKQLGEVNVHTENAEHLSAILPKLGVEAPSVVVMNPPFSQTAGRMGDKKELMTGANHVEEGLKLLKDGGRLVAIVGGGISRVGGKEAGMSPNSSTYRSWFKRMMEKYNLRANMAVGGDEYKKYGTNFGTRVLIFDKDGPTKGEPVTGTADSIPDLMAKLEGVRNDRPHQQPSSEPAPGLAPGGEDLGDLAAKPEPQSAPGAGGGVDGGASGDASVAGLPGGASGQGAGTPGGPGSGVRDESAPTGPGESVGGSGGGGGSRGGTGKRSGRTGGNAPVEQPGTGGPKSRRKSIQLHQVHVPELRPAEPLNIEIANPEEEAAKKKKAEVETTEDSLYENYTPSLLRVPGSFQHPTPLVETQAMAAVRPPVPTYRPHLSPDIIGQNKNIRITAPDGSVHEHPMGVSEAGLESVVYAGQAHEKMLPAPEQSEEQKAAEDAAMEAMNSAQIGTPEYEDAKVQYLAAKNKITQAYRRGYFIGDGTGSGKGREIGAIIADNINQGRKKHVWISEKWPLEDDAKRDLGDVGVHPDKLVSWDELKKGGFAHPEGIAFVTYSTLRGTPKTTTDVNEMLPTFDLEGNQVSGEAKPLPADKKPNVDRLIEWLGPDFDGVIAFDEAHNMGNASTVKKARGKSEPSQQALAGLKLQQALPKARVVYVSATGATEVRNLAYADRLGLWGRGTPFANRDDFVGKISEGGTAAMEAVAQSMKAMGMYGARSLAMSDGTEKGTVTFDRLQHKLTDEQQYMHKNLSETWQQVLKKIDDAIAATTPPDKKGKPIKNGGAQRSNAISQFWGANQRFWNQVLTSFQTPTTIAAMEKDIAEGRAPVVSLASTMEASTTRAVKGKAPEDEYEELDLSPKEILISYLKASFPIHRQQEVTDQNGNVSTQVVLGPDGEPLVDPVAKAIRDEMIANVNELRIPESPLDQIINHFGHDKVAEVTGRKLRLINKPDEKGQIRRQREDRNSDLANRTEAQAFQDGKKKILIFSPAGGTGRSYHADRNAKNQGRRSFYMLQPGWRADAAVQALGRANRTNQTSAPLVHLVEIPEIPGQRRFVSTIARRLAQLGALTRGERKAGSSGLFTEADNLENPIAQQALDGMFNDLKNGQVEGLQYNNVLDALGIAEPDAGDEGGWRRQTQKQVPEVPMNKFLNRLLSADIPTQHKLMNALEGRIQAEFSAALARGTVDTGVENFNQNWNADKVEKTGDRVVFRDPESGAEVRHLKAKVYQKTDKRSWEEAKKGTQPQHYVLNARSGRVWAVYPAYNRTDEKGTVIPQVMLKGPTGGLQIIDGWRMSGRGGYEPMEEASAKTAWDKEYKSAPEHTVSEQHFISGAMLPVWDRLPESQPKIYRVKLSNGESTVARHIPADQVEETMKRLGAGQEQEAATDHSPDTLHEQLRAGAHRIKLSNGWTIKPALVQGERRIELEGPLGMHRAELTGDGVFEENIQSKRRFFVPVGKDGARVIANLTRHRPVVAVDDLGKGAYAPVE